MKRWLQGKKSRPGRKCRSYFGMSKTNCMMVWSKWILNVSAVEKIRIGHSFKRRMKQGKEAGAKKGMWTNGKPPFPTIMIREIHPGYITYGKTRTKRDQVEIVPEEERIKVMRTMRN